jgi:hypothetical protein
MTNLYSRGAIVALFALGGLGLGTPASAFALSQYVTADELKAHCDAAGGVFNQAGSISACATDKGSVACDSQTKKCTGSNGNATIEERPTGPAFDEPAGGSIFGNTAHMPSGGLAMATSQGQGATATMQTTMN